MKRKRMRSIRQIIEDAGGAKKIAEASRKTKWAISAKSVYDWPEIGIVDMHWPILVKLAKATLKELVAANAKAPKRKAGRKIKAEGKPRPTAEADKRAA